MPVLGHAFVGIATAMTVRPSRRAALAAAVWMPALVALAYLPDIACQAAAGGGSSVSLHFDALDAGTYFLFVDGLNGTAGDYNITVNY